MKTELRAKNIQQPQDYQEHASRKIALELSRYRDRLSGVTVWLEDLNGPKGGVDKRCRVRVNGPEVGQIVAESRDVDLKTALGRAISIAGRAVARSLRRLQRRGLFASRSLAQDM